MKEIDGFNQLLNIRRKNAPYTNLIVMGIDRRKRIIEEIGARPPGNDTFVGILWMAMGPATKTHVSSKVDTEEAEYPDLREAVIRYTSLAGATSTRTPTAKGIGSIEEAKEKQEEQQWAAEEEGGGGEHDDFLN